MRKIRIGNDIRLAVDLRQFIGYEWLKERKVYIPGDPNFENKDSNIFVNKKTEVYWPKDTWEDKENVIEFDPTNTPICIRSAKAVLINTSRQAKIEQLLRRKTRFVSRFPIEPHFECYRSTPYDICSSGCPTWRAYPHRHYPMPYHGFGVYPEWDGIYKPLPMHNDTEYRAQVYATAKQNVLEVSFPAKAQRYTGVYKLVIVAQVYAPGFNANNLKTITVDAPDVFELVSTTEQGIDTGISIKVQEAVDILPRDPNYDDDIVEFGDIYVNEGAVEGNNISLSRTDGGRVDIDLSELTEWYNDDNNIG